MPDYRSNIRCEDVYGLKMQVLQYDGYNLEEVKSLVGEGAARLDDDGRLLIWDGRKWVFVHEDWYVLKSEGDDHFGAMPDNLFEELHDTEEEW